jgi:hypothetical protein
MAVDLLGGLLEVDEGRDKRSIPFGRGIEVAVGGPPVLGSISLETFSVPPRGWVKPLAFRQP